MISMNLINQCKYVKNKNVFHVLKSMLPKGSLLRFAAAGGVQLQIYESCCN